MESRRLSDESIKPPTLSVMVLLLHETALLLKQEYNFLRCLKQDKVTFTHRTIVNLYIVYE